MASTTICLHMRHLIWTLSCQDSLRFTLASHFAFKWLGSPVCSEQYRNTGNETDITSSFIFAHKIQERHTTGVYKVVLTHSWKKITKALQFGVKAEVSTQTGAGSGWRPLLLIQTSENMQLPKQMLPINRDRARMCRVWTIRLQKYNKCTTCWAKPKPLLRWGINKHFESILTYKGSI